MEQIITHFTDNDAYTYSCLYYILETYPRGEVEYTFFDRNHTCYPKGFDKLLQEQVDYMPGVVITDEEIDFMARKMYYLPLWFFVFLKGYRFNPAEVAISQDEQGHLGITIKGKWYSTIMWEMVLLSCISQLMHTLNGDIDRYDAALEEQRSREKARKALKAGLVISDFGQRRRFSMQHHDMVVRTFKEVQDEGGYTDAEGQFKKWPGKFVGTSNVYLAMKYDLTPIGTMSHQLVEFEENVSGVYECNFNVMKKFSDVYDGDNGIALPTV